ncbi:MAG: Gfo/Idh/MocA family oxidoreductase [Candidatus Sumerlaeia bacterium]|nr:Gfo/Idh/MocA family oxidoreductase [Candidatus Sumerlaeia bacterium]
MPTTSKPLGLGVIGCGYWGPNLIRNFNLLKSVDVRRVADLSEERRGHIQELYPQIDVVADHRQILEDPAIDAVAIATPVPSHFPLASEALDRGKHVFVEKPLCETASQGDSLLALAKARGKVLFVGHTFLYAPAVTRIRDIVASGELGEIFYVSSRRLNLGLLQRDINVIHDLAPHDLSILHFVLGQEPVAVTAVGSWHYQEGVEDVAVVTLHYPGNLVAHLHFSWLDPKKVREMVFVGSEKMLVYDDVEGTEKLRIHDKRVVRPDYYDTFGEFQFSYHYGDIHVPWLPGAEPLRAECAHFVECITTGVTPRSGGPEGLRVVRLLEAANQSMRSRGGRIELAR